MHHSGDQASGQTGVACLTEIEDTIKHARTVTCKESNTAEARIKGQGNLHWAAGGDDGCRCIEALHGSGKIVGVTESVTANEPARENHVQKQKAWVLNLVHPSRASLVTLLSGKVTSLRPWHKEQVKRVTCAQSHSLFSELFITHHRTKPGFYLALGV